MRQTRQIVTIETRHRLTRGKKLVVLAIALYQSWRPAPDAYLSPTSLSALIDSSTSSTQGSILYVSVRTLTIGERWRTDSELGDTGRATKGPYGPNTEKSPPLEKLFPK